MCGLVGAVGVLLEQDKKVFRTLLRLDVIRGEDSTGVAAISKYNNDIHVYKKVGAPDILFNTYEDFSSNGVYKPSTKLLIGHNRAATKGLITDANAHPFLHDNIVGAHNGTLTSVSTLEKGDTFEVDSEAIFYNLSKYTPESVIPDIWGAYALTWYDADEDKLYIIRNSQRPLHWARRKDRDVIFWSSRKDILEMALDREAVTFEPVQSFETNTLYSFDCSTIDDGKMRQTNWETQKGLEGYSPPPPPPKPKPVYTSNTTGGTSNNVSPFPRATLSNTSTRSYAANENKRTEEELSQMKALQGQKILFRIKGVEKGMGKMQYLSCYPDNPMFDWDIRLFAENHRMWNKWKGMANRATFSGEVRRMVTNSVHGKKEHYLLIDLRTVSEWIEPEKTKVDDKELEDGQFYEGFKGKWLTLDEFTKATQRGCAGCQRPADIEDTELVFIADDDFLCGECSTLDGYKDYIPNLK